MKSLLKRQDLPQLARVLKLRIKREKLDLDQAKHRALKAILISYHAFEGVVSFDLSLKSVMADCGYRITAKALRCKFKARSDHRVTKQSQFLNFRRHLDHLSEVVRLVTMAKYGTRRDGEFREVEWRLCIRYLSACKGALQPIEDLKEMLWKLDVASQ